MVWVYGRVKVHSIFIGFAPLFCAAISMVTGLFGFRIASSKDLGHLQAYLLSLTIGFTIQVVNQIVLSRGKDRFFRWGQSVRLFPRPRTGGAIVVTLAMGLLLVLSSAVWPGADAGLPLMLGLSTLAALLQAATFEASSLACVQDLKLFWVVQTLGALIRGLVLLLLPFLSGMHLAWVLLSQCAAAMTGVIVYYCLGRVGFQPKRGWRFLRRAKGAVLSFEGGLRAVRPQLMALAVSGLGAMAPVFLEDATALNLMLVTPYVMAYYSVFHQVIQPMEVDFFRRGWSAARFGVVMLATLLLAISILWFCSAFPSLLLWVLPGDRVQEVSHLAVPLAATVGASSLLLGFGVTDYLSLPKLKTMFIAAMLAFLVMVAFALMVSGRLQLLWITLTPVVSLGLGTRIAFFRKARVF